MSDELLAQEGAETEAAVTVDVPALEIPLAGARLAVHRNPDNGDRVLVVGPVLTTFVVPLGAETARALAQELAGGVVLPAGTPAMAIPKGKPGR